MATARNIYVRIPNTRAEQFIDLIPMGDVHVGLKCTDLKYFRSMVSWVLSDYDRYVIGMGDYMDSIIHTDKRFDIDLLDKNNNTIEKQIKTVVDLYKPLADEGRLLGMLEGNHEAKLRTHTQNKVLNQICEQLKVPNLGYESMLTLNIQCEKTKGEYTTTQRYGIYATHGSGGSSSRSGRVGKLERLTQIADADLYLMGHVHDCFITSDIRFRICGSKYVPYKYMCACTGGFLQSRTTDETPTYLEQGNFKPLRVGVPKIQFHPKRHDIHGSA
jgi:UDP-2,3-diacylglucosamine pyrophosphatase LpxH